MRKIQKNLIISNYRRRR